jgi:pimeloyl-ACP methyl ester carboxylesterase
MLYLGEHLASHSYVVVGIDHFAVDKSDLGNIMETDNASVIGYSMGGYAAINTTGGCDSLTQ